jgi:hypothetical protein
MIATPAGAGRRRSTPAAMPPEITASAVRAMPATWICVLATETPKTRFSNQGKNATRIVQLQPARVMSPARRLILATAKLYCSGAISTDALWGCMVLFYGVFGNWSPSDVTAREPWKLMGYRANCSAQHPRMRQTRVERDDGRRP